MASLIEGYAYDIFISYRHKDNKGDQWVTEFVNALKAELEATFKESISIYFDTNPHDGLSDHHDVDLSLREKVKSLVLIPIISQTYCDQKSFAWKNEFIPFRDLASSDSFGLKVKVANENVASRILPVRIHELDSEDLNVLEKELGSKLRAIDFIFKSAGVNRPLIRSDSPDENFNKSVFRDQINRVANAVKEIIDALQAGSSHDRASSQWGRFHGLNQTIPTPVTALLGRESELNELTDLLGKNKVVTIVGPGGMGKTRLSLELCHRLKDEFLGNAVFVSMAALTEAADVIPTLADALGIKEAEGRSLTKGISSVIADRKTLLVLDNLEQVISAAPQIAELASSCANLKILTTSRTPLKIRAECEYVLNPLLLPPNRSFDSIEILLTYPSVSLFVERAQKANGSFRLTEENANEVVQICQRLDGLPLALELAAARTRMLSPKQLLPRLEHALDVLISGAKDLPERHQTLRATIDWSYSLLTDTEKILFRRMSVFSGGCDLEAIEQTCYEENSSRSLDELESLVEKGLVQHAASSDRFMMLQVIKEFAIEKLDAAGETNKVKSRQAQYFLNLAMQVGQGFESKDQAAAMQRGILEEGNTQSVLDFLLNLAKGGDAEANECGLLICGYLYFFWHVRCKHIMARHYSNSFLSLPHSAPASKGKCFALNTVGVASSTLGHAEQSLKEHQAAYEIASAANDKSTMALCRLGMVIAIINSGDVEQAGKWADECFQLSIETGLDFKIGLAYLAIGILNTVKGDLEAAKVSFESGLVFQDKIHDKQGGGLSRGGLAMLSNILGQYDQSIELYTASLSSFATIGDRGEEARIQEEMAWVFLKMERVKDAREHFIESIRAYEDVGSVRGIGIALFGIAGVESVEHNHSRAIEIATAAQLFTETEGVVNNYGEGFQGKPYIEAAKSKLTAEELTRAVDSGSKLSLRDTLQLVNGNSLITSS